MLVKSESTWSYKSKVVSGDNQGIQTTQRRSTAYAHYQSTIRVNGPTDGQGVHVLREQRLMRECVTDASIVQYLMNRDLTLETGGFIHKQDGAPKIKGHQD